MGGNTKRAHRISIVNVEAERDLATFMHLYDEQISLLFCKRTVTVESGSQVRGADFKKQDDLASVLIV